MAASIAVAIVAVMFVGWMLTTLARALRGERATQHPADRYPLAISLAIGTLAAVTAIVLTDEPRAGFRLGMAGLAIAATIQAIIRHRQKR